MSELREDFRTNHWVVFVRRAPTNSANSFGAAHAASRRP
jgi:hypothetical protein